jgi:hypothetical protein
MARAVPLALAVIGPPALFAFGLNAGLPGIVLVVLVLIPIPAFEAILALRYRPVWAAQDVYLFLSWRTAQEWSQHVGGTLPTNARQAAAWLDRHPEEDVEPNARASMLLTAGRIADARAIIAGMPARTARERRRRAELSLAADELQGLPLDTAAADEAMRADPGESPEVVAAHLGYHAALKAADEGGDCVSPLLQARPRLGRLTPALLVRIWIWRLIFTVSAAALGAWLIVGLVVGLATSGGVVWF